MATNRPIFLKCLYPHDGQSEIPCCFIVFVISTINVCNLVVILDSIWPLIDPFCLCFDSHNEQNEIPCLIIVFVISTFAIIYSAE